MPVGFSNHSNRDTPDRSSTGLSVAEMLLMKVAGRVGKGALRLAAERSEILKQLDMEIQ